MPLRPGTGSTILLLRYSLPYEDGLSLTQSVLYPVDGVNLVLPEVGVSLTGDSEWVDMGQQALEVGSFRSFSHGPIAAGDSFTLALDGEPRLTSGGSAAARPSNTTELVVGGAALLIVAVVAALLVRSWRPRQAEEALDRDALLEEIADLDDAYDNGEISEKEYRRERQALKEQLMALWEPE
jgi:hypothetical protein